MGFGNRLCIRNRDLLDVELSNFLCKFCNAIWLRKICIPRSFQYVNAFLYICEAFPNRTLYLYFTSESSVFIFYLRVIISKCIFCAIFSDIPSQSVAVPYKNKSIKFLNYEYV